MRTTLDEYARASDQVVNYEKSKICLGQDVEEETCNEIAGLLGVVHTNCHENYLGLPSVMGRKKKRLSSLCTEKYRTR